jgi:hypothetical protein
MFNFVPQTGVPGFRVGLPENLPGFRINQDDSVRRVNSADAPAYGLSPYALDSGVAAAPTAPPTPVATDDYLSGDNCEL